MSEPPDPLPPSRKRIVYVIRFQIRCATADRSVIVWTQDNKRRCAYLMNPRRTWMTARAGDAQMLTRNGEERREHIEAVELYRVSPAEWNGTIVDSALDWMEAAEKAQR